MPFVIKFWECSLSDSDMYRYLVKHWLLQSPLAWIINAVPPHWCKKVAAPLRKLCPLYSAASTPAFFKRDFNLEVKEEYVTYLSAAKEKAGAFSWVITLENKAFKCLTGSSAGSSLPGMGIRTSRVQKLFVFP